jgi:hypothetical protein
MFRIPQTRAAGIYVISPEYKQGSMYIKVGMANSDQLHKRLDGYLLYYPRGYYVFGIVTCRGTHVRDIEREMHAYLKKKGYGTALPHGHSEEWFEVPASEIESIINVIAAQTGVLKKYAYDPPQILSAGETVPRRRPAMGTPQKRKFESAVPVPPQTQRKGTLRPSTDVNKRRKVAKRLFA